MDRFATDADEAPADWEHDAADASTSDPIAATGSTRAPHPGFVNDRWQVLLIDDCVFNRTAAMLWLARLGCDVHACCDAESGLEALRARRFDLAIFDCGLPRMDGWTAARLWRDEEAATNRRPLPIIAWTASDLPDLRERSLAAGMDGLLAKPSSGVCFADIVAQFLSKVEAAVGEAPAETYRAEP